MTIIVSQNQEGKPPEEGVYVVRFRASSKEEFSWWDGHTWSTGSNVAFFAEQGQEKGKRMSISRRAWRPVRYWRTYSNDGQVLIDALRKAIEK